MGGRDQTREEAVAEMFQNSRFSSMAARYKEEKPNGKKRPSFGGENIGIYDDKVYFVVDQKLGDFDKATATIVRIPASAVDLACRTIGDKVSVTVDRQNNNATVLPGGTSLSRRASLEGVKGKNPAKR